MILDLGVVARFLEPRLVYIRLAPRDEALIHGLTLRRERGRVERIARHDLQDVDAGRGLDDSARLARRERQRDCRELVRAADAGDALVEIERRWLFDLESRRLGGRVERRAVAHRGGDAFEPRPRALLALLLLAAEADLARRLLEGTRALGILADEPSDQHRVIGADRVGHLAGLSLERPVHQALRKSDARQEAVRLDRLELRDLDAELV